MNNQCVCWLSPLRGRTPSLKFRIILLLDLFANSIILKQPQQSLNIYRLSLIVLFRFLLQ